MPKPTWKDFSRVILTVSRGGKWEKSASGFGNKYVGVFLSIEMFLSDVCRDFEGRHQHCPENHVLPFHSIFDAFLLSKESSGSCPVSGLEFTDVV